MLIIVFLSTFSALNKFHSPLNHHNHSFENDFRSSTLLFAEHENPLFLSAELCLTSLSSDSGILTAKLSDISNSGEFDKSPIRQQMENCGNEKYFGDVDDGNKTENGEEKKCLSRSDSVRARANMFQAMEEHRLKINTDDVQRIAKCKNRNSCCFFMESLLNEFLDLLFTAKSYIASPPERVVEFDPKKEHRDNGE